MESHSLDDSITISRLFLYGSDSSVVSPWAIFKSELYAGFFLFEGVSACLSPGLGGPFEWEHPGVAMKMSF